MYFKTEHYLFTPEEMQEWQQKEREARSEGHIDWKIQDNLVRAFKHELYQRLVAHPEELTNVFLYLLEQGVRPKPGLTYEQILTPGAKPPYLDQVDTPEKRRLLHTILQGLRQVPQSWAKSATTRFFRGIGKQAQKPWSEKPGAGILNKDSGWNQSAVTWFIERFYDYPFRGLFFEDDSIDPYGEDGEDVSENGGNRFAATRKERNDLVFDRLLATLEARGLGDPVSKPEPKPTKPHVVKVFEVGKPIKNKDVRDLPDGSHFRFTIHRLRGYARVPDDPPSTVHYTWEGVFHERTAPGTFRVSPVINGVCMAPQEVQQPHMFDEAVFLGPWQGQTIDVEPKEWKPVSRKKTSGHDAGVKSWEYGAGFYP